MSQTERKYASVPHTQQIWQITYTKYAQHSTNEMHKSRENQYMQLII